VYPAGWPGAWVLYRGGFPRPRIDAPGGLFAYLSNTILRTPEKLGVTIR
jgi:hypothetical protein